MAPYRGQALLDEAKAIDMSKRQGQQYVKAIQAQKEVEDAAALRRAEAAEAKRQAPEWKANESKMRDSVIEEVSTTPKFVADMGIRNGEIPKLDGNSLTDEEKSALGRRYWSASEGMLPDRVAARLGYDSGHELVQDLSLLNHNRGDVAPEKYLKDLVERETQWRMEQKYGKFDENVLDAAREMALHSTNIDLMHAELEAIADRDGREMPFKKEDMISMAKNTVAQKAMAGVKPDSYWALISRIDQKIEKALLDQDFAEAFRQRQMRFNTMVALKEARRIEKVQQSFEKLASRYSKMTLNTVPKNIDADYLGPIQTILNRIGYNVRRKIVNIESMMQKGGFKDFESFVQQKEGMFASLHVPEFLLDPDWQKPIERMTAEEFESVAKALKAMDFNAKEEKKITVAGEKMEYEEFLNKAIEQIKEIGPAKPDRSDQPVNQVTHLFKQFGWSGIQLESMMRRIDKGDSEGLMNQGVVRIVTEASGYRERLLKEVRGMLNDLPKLGDWDKHVSNSLFMDKWDQEVQPPLQMTRRQLRGVMLHLGSDSSWKKLTEGYDVAPDMVKEWMGRHATKEEWDWVQGIGKIFDHLSNLADNMSYETSGVGIDRLELKPVEIKWTENGRPQAKTVDGWYNPIMYNKERIGAPKFDPKSLMQEGYYKADTNQRYTMERTGFRGPVQLSSDAVEIRMLQMVHDIAMRPAVKQLGKLFTNQRFTQAIRRHYSGAVADSLFPYLRDAANVAEFESASEGAISKAIGGLVQNVISTEIGFNPGTVLKHGPSAMFNSIHQVGLVPWANEFRKVLSDSSYRDQMIEESDELNRRTHNYADLLQGSRSGQVRLPGARTGIIAKGLDLRAMMQLVGQYPVAISDMLSSIPTYAAERNKQIALGNDLGQARFLADQQVRLAHGSSIFTNKPEIMRQRNPLARSFTSIYGYVNEQLNKQYEAAWRAKQAWGDIKKGDMPDLRKQIGTIAGIITFRVLIFGAIEDIVSGGGDPRKGSLWRFGELLANGTMGRFAYIRDMVYPMFHGGEGGNFLDTATKGLNAPFRDISQGFHTPQAAGKFINDLNVFTGYTLGVGYHSVGKMEEFLTNYFRHAEHPQGTWQWLEGLRYGTNKGHARSAEEWLRNQTGHR